MEIQFPKRNGESAKEILRLNGKDVFHKEGEGIAESFEINNKVVIIGANGSGKSRMGVWIDQANSADISIYRISANRALQIPNNVPMKNLSTAKDEFLFGREKKAGNDDAIKFDAKYGGQPAIHLQNDYQIVLSMLFAKVAKRNEDYVNSSKENTTNVKLPIPNSVIEDLSEIWNYLLPHRTILLEDYKVMVSNGNSYHGKEMSDGERVILYLIASCLCVRQNSLIIVDEPELHIHKVLMSKLWTQIEEKRPDCQFIYITHDLDFAVSRTNAKKIWVKEHNGQSQWIWEEVPEKEEIPEELMLQIVGSRKPILFVEGKKGNSLDLPIYEAVYPEFTIIPRGNCSKVIEGAKAMQDNENLHTNKVYGLIDRDYRPDNELQELLNNGVFHIDLGEVENLLCIPNIIKVVAEHLGYENPVSIVESCTDKIFELFAQNKEEQIYKRTVYIIRNNLKKLKEKGKNLSDLMNDYETLTSNIDLKQEYKKNEELYNKILNSKDLIFLLRYYTNKGLASNLNSIIADYKSTVMRLLLRTDKKEQIVEIWRNYLPEISVVNKTT
jgi:energy-coupling factor transporter ATP-binding protein EcfA2